MNDKNRCPKCNGHLVADAPQGLCPVCLLEHGIQRTPENLDPMTTSTGGKFVPPTVDQLNKLFPQFDFRSMVGQGGMGAVYRVRQKSLDRTVAVKILPPDVGSDPTFAERFAREAKAMARLTHPNILSIHEFGETNGQYFLVMEFVDGINLRQAIQTKSLCSAESLCIVQQICDALQFAHDEGIVHRDIKPENILVDKKGRIKIADFGLAKLLSRSPVDITLTSAHQVMGTLHYMAPEQIERPLDVDHRADIYSLGVVFYELLTGQLPLGRFPLPSTMVGVEQSIDEVVLRTLERDPGHRYQHASDVRSDVDKYSVDAKVPEYRAPKSPHLDIQHSPTVTFRPGLLAFGVALLIAGMSLMVLGLFINRNEYFWSGLGTMIASGAIASQTWLMPRPGLGVSMLEEHGRVAFGAVLLMVGFIVFALGGWREVSAMIWAGFGLMVVAGAVAQSAWRELKDQESPHDQNKIDESKPLIALALVACLFLSGARVHAQGTLGADPRASTGNGPVKLQSNLAIDEGLFININGHEQWVTIRGRNLSNPVLLLLHGGPGIGNAAVAPAFAEWEHHFTIVQWDQPGSGFTYMKNPAHQGEMSIARYTKDGITVIEHVLKRLQKDRLVLLGHSWGTLIGLEMIKARPELFSAYVGTSQAVGEAGNKLGYALALKAARERIDATAIAALERIGEPPYEKFEDFFTRQQYSNPPALPQSDAEKAKTVEYFGHLATPPGPDAKYLPLEVLAPEQMIQDPTKLWNNFVEVQKLLFRETWSWEARSLGTKFDLPIFVYQGALDINTPPQPADDWVREIQVPRKGFELIPEAGHNTIVFQEELLRLINRDVRPLVATSPMD